MLLASIFLLHLSCAIGQTFPDFKFRYLTMKDGLSDDYVTAILQDKNGFIWLGTSNGLNRYDGKGIKQFFHDHANPNSLISNRIWEMLVDHKNRIWINTPNGLCCYDQYTDSFTSFSHHPTDKNSLPESLANSLYLGIDNKLWISTYKGFYSVNDNMQLQHESIPVWKADTLQLIQPIYRDNNNRLWTFTNRNIYQLDGKTMQPIKSFPSHSIGTTTNILQDKLDRYWVTTAEGNLFQFNENSGHFSAFKLPVKERSLYAAYQWHDNDNSWLIIPGFSLTLINIKTLESVSFPPNIYNKTGYQGTFWTKMFTDKDNRIWMGYEKGCNVLQMSLQKTTIIPMTLPGQLPYMEPDHFTTDLFHADQENYWVTTGRGILRYDHNWQFISYHKSLIPLSKTTLNETSYPYECKRYGNYLYLTGNFGLIEWDLVSDHTRLIPLPEIGKTPHFSNIAAISADEWLLRTAQDGLYVFNAKKKIITRHLKPGTINDSFIPEYITYLYQTSKGRIFITSKKELVEYDPKHDIFFKHSLQENSIPVTDYYITALDEDDDGMLWIGSMKGIYLYNPAKRKVIKQFPESKVMGPVHNILVDKENNVWCNTRSHIWCWIRKNERWTSYSSLDGLPADVYESVLQLLPDSSIITGIGEKMVQFAPGFLNQNINASSAVYITDVSTEKSNISFAGKTTSQNKIVLEPGEKSFSVDFAVLNYDHPNAIKYLYKLVPVMKEFTENPSGHLNFNYLPPGKYKLLVKGSDKLGNLTKKTDTLDIIIKPYWYQTVWFWILIAGTVAAFVFLLVKRRIAVIRREASLKRKISETEMAALKAQMNPHFMFNCINSIDAFIHSNDKYNATLYLNKFAKLLRNILDSSKHNTVSFSKDIETLKLYIELEELRNDNKFKTIIDIDNELLESDYKVPPLIIQPFVENAILHGLKNKDGKDGLLEIRIKKQGETIEYSIKDNGIGRSAAQLIAQNKDSSYGMQLSYDRIRLFNKENEASVKVTDLYENNIATGTFIQVELKII